MDSKAFEQIYIKCEEGGQSEPISIKIEDIESVTINGHDFALEEME